MSAHSQHNTECHVISLLSNPWNKLKINKKINRFKFFNVVFFVLLKKFGAVDGVGDEGDDFFVPESVPIAIAPQR